MLTRNDKDGIPYPSSTAPLAHNLPDGSQVCREAIPSGRGKKSEKS